MRTQHAAKLLVTGLLLTLLAVVAAPLAAHTEAASEALALPAVPEVDVLDFNVEMARFLAEHVKLDRTSSGRLLALMDAIYSDKGLGIDYENTGTKTAAETFESRSGNCLSFTFMFVAMARHLGLDAYFMEVGEVLSWDRKGGVVLRNQHMYVEVESNNVRIQVDFIPETEKRYRLVKRIGDRRALAHYYNNLGAEWLAGGDALRSAAYFKHAVEIDDTFTHAWTNLGVAYRRLGALELAERSHLQAIELDPSELTPVSNLASLYQSTGRYEEAAPLMERARDYLQRNPFHHFRLGTESAAAGDPEAAAEHFRRAIRRMPREPEFHAALGRALAEAGDLERAETSLRKAIRLADNAGYRQQLTEELAALVPEGQP